MNSKQTLIASVLAGIGASLCCVAPLVLISLGIGGAWMATLTAFEPVRPVLLGLAFHKLYQHQHANPANSAPMMKSFASSASFFGA